MLEAGQMDPGQAWLSLAAWAASCHLLSRLFQGSWRQGLRLVEQGTVCGVGAASVTGPDLRRALQGAQASAFPVEAYGRPVSNG